jgi:hypothetical protein
LGVGKESIVMFEFTTWHVSFEDFFIIPTLTVIGKQLLISNDRNREILGLSQDGACTDLFEIISVNSQSNAIPFQSTSFLMGQIPLN